MTWQTSFSIFHWTKPNGSTNPFAITTQHTSPILYMFTRLCGWSCTLSEVRSLSLLLILSSLKPYSHKGTLDLFIVYTRIQMLCPRLKFLSKTSIYLVSFLIFIFSVAINVPINLSRTMVTTSFQIRPNSTSVLGTYGDWNQSFFINKTNLLFYYLLQAFRPM